MKFLASYILVAYKKNCHKLIFQSVGQTGV